MLALNWAPMSGGLVISNAAWDRMTPGQQAVVKSSASEACEKLTKRARQEMVESVAAMEKRGLTVQRLEGELLKEWTDYFEAIHPRVRGSVVPAPAFDQIMKLLSDYRSDSNRGNP